MPRPAVFLDRDGTLNVRAAEHDYIRSVEEFRWLPDAIAGMVALGEAGLPLVVVSNQRGVDRGLVSADTLRAIEQRIQDALRPHGQSVSAFKYCVHGLEEGCDCRKPQPGMLLAAARELDLDLERSWMIGDSDTDVQAGERAGSHTILITDERRPGTATARTLLDAAGTVLATAEVS